MNKEKWIGDPIEERKLCPICGGDIKALKETIKSWKTCEEQGLIKE